MAFSMPDWHAMFVPQASLLELVLRGSFMYLLVLAGLRVLRREIGSLSMTDLLVLVVIADAAQNAMSGGYGSITEGAVLVGTIFGWDYALDFLAYRVPAIHRLIHPRPLVLVVNGQVQQRNLRSQLLTEEDLMEQLREHGVEHLSEVGRCYLESDGRLSVLWHAGRERPRRSERKSQTDEAHP